MPKPNPPYEAYIIGHSPLHGIIPGKFYLTEIRGREAQQQREWKHSNLNPALIKTGIELKLEDTKRLFHIPHIVIAMPHVTRVYRFGNPNDPLERETNFYTTLYNTATMDIWEPTDPTPLPAQEIGCDGEIAILARERDYWNQAPSVEEYLKLFIPYGSLGKVTNPNKLAQFKALADRLD